MRGLHLWAVIASTLHFPCSPRPCHGLWDLLCSLEASTALVCQASDKDCLFVPPGRQRAEEQPQPDHLHCGWSCKSGMTWQGPRDC